MIGKEPLALIKKILGLFGSMSGMPIEFYEVDSNGRLEATVPGDPRFFPEYCRFVWELGGGKGKQRCIENMCQRAQVGFESQERGTHWCHAGLTTGHEPVVVGSTTIGVLQYGAIVLEGEDAVLAEQRAQRRRAAVRALEGTSDDVAKLDRLFQDVPKRSDVEWNEIRHSLPRIVGDLIETYLSERRREEDSLQAAYHDLQLRLAAARHAIEYVLARRPFEAPVLDDLRSIQGTIDAANTITQNMTRGEYLPSNVTLKLQDLRVLINRALALCRPEAMNRGLELSAAYHTEGPVRAWVSTEHLQQAINNVMQNAVKYSYRTTTNSNTRFVSVRVRARTTEKGHGFEISVSNYGVGIEPDEYQDVFTENYRGRLTTPEYRSGTGRGLALARQFVARHGGTVSVESEPTPGGAGPGWPYLTRFNLWIPSRIPVVRSEGR